MFNLEELVRPNILTLQPYSSARDEYTGSDGIFIDANENPFGDLNRYPDPKQRTLKKQIGILKSINPEWIFLGNGSDEIIDLCFRIFCDPGEDSAMVFTPTYGMYEVSAAINNIAIQKLPLDSEFQINVDAILPLLEDKNLKIIFICSPNNPTGNLINAAEFIIQNFKGIVVIDEAYIDFATSASLKEKITAYPNLIVLQTFSKMWGIASARIGVAITDPKIVALFNKVKPPYNISSLNQKAALQIIEQKEMVMQQRQIILAEREIMISELQKLSFVRKVYPSEANFVLTEVDDADVLYQKLLDSKIVVRNRNSVVRNCLRITIGSPDENLNLITALKNFNL